MSLVIFIDNTAHHLFGQMHLLGAFRKQGSRVIFICPDDGLYFNLLKTEGYEGYPINLNIRTQNPLRDIKLIGVYYSLFKRFKPDLICGFTIKPNLYGAIAARMRGISFIANVTGLGYAFMRDNWLQKLIIRLYRYSFSAVVAVFFQNRDDEQLFQQCKIVRKSNSFVLFGDGVNTDRFYYRGLKQRKNVKFLFSGRLLKDKGIVELVAAMQLVKQVYPDSELLIVGNYFLENPSAIYPEQMEKWVKQDLVTYLGMVNDVPAVLGECDCVVLPSYREGMPRSLLEACSMGKPIISVMTPGCREVIRDSYNGLVAEVRNVESLAQAMLKFIELPYEAKLQLGVNGRQMVVEHFEQADICSQYMKIVNQVLKK